MRISVFFLFFFAAQTYATVTYSQQTRLTLKMQGAKVIDVLNKIEAESEFFFLFNQKLLDVERQVNVDVKNESIENILSEIFEKTNVSFLVKDRQIILTTATITATEQPQQKRISGKVTDSTGGSLPGVSVVVKGTTTGIVTDANGNYSLSNIPENATLQFSFVGMKMQEVAVGNKTAINITLAEETIGLEEVVAVGYGTQKKATLTGAISQISGNTIQSAPVINYTNSLAGRLPGLSAITKSGEPGANDATLRIRGANTLGDNSPLIVIDGIANRSMGQLNPATIESVTVLKDASAAIYGAQAANGVILVTTKRGSVEKLKVDLTLNTAWNTPTVITKMADAATYAQLENEIDMYRGQSPRYTSEDIQMYKDGSNPWTHPNTDWFKSIFKPFSLQHSANLSVHGGTKELKYFVSLGTKYEDGIYRNSATNYSQVDFRSNIDAKISKNISLSIDLSGRQENRNYPIRSSATILANARQSKPLLPAYWPNGLPGPDIEAGNNPAVVSTDAGGYEKDKRYIMESNVKLDITIPWIDGLSVTGNASFDKRIRNDKLWEKPWTLYSWDYSTYDALKIPVLLANKKGLTNPQLTQTMGDGHSTTLNALINYKHSIAEKHNISILLGTERITGESMNFSAFRKYFVSTQIEQLFAGGDLDKDNSGSANSNARLNYFGRLNYNYQDKYMAEFVFRNDGSYIFPDNKRFGFFPGVSLGWRISEESFWKENITFVNSLKLRASWGQTGNDRILPYQYLSSFGFVNSVNPYVFNSKVEKKRLAELRIPNLNVTWEIANQSNIGFDAEILQGKIQFHAEYFYNLRTNILWVLNASVPASTGLTLPLQNLGKVANQGYEFQLGYNDRIGNFTYAFSVNGSFAKNKILFWDETPGVPDYQKSTGHPMNSQLYYRAIGIFKDQQAVDAYPHWAGAVPGDIIFEDVNKDGKINGIDMVRDYKTDLPTFSGGMTFDFGYKNFTANILLQGATGAARIYPTYSGDVGNFPVEEIVGRWTPDNTNASKPRTWNRDDQYWSLNAGINNTYFLRNNDYLRLKNIQIGYNLPDKLVKKLGISGLKVYVSGFNLATLTKYQDYYDPETVGDSAYPPNKVYNVGINVNF